MIRANTFRGRRNRRGRDAKDSAGNRGVGGNGTILHNVFHDGNTVDSVAQSQTHILVVQSGNIVHVQGQVPQVAGAGNHQFGLAFYLLNLIAGQHDDIQIAVLCAG